MTNEVRACYLDMGFVLNGQPNGQKFPGYDKPGDYTPEVRQDYVLPDWAKKYFAQWLRFSARLGALYVTGPSGCGKTSAIKQVAARANWPVYECTAHGRLEMSDLIGHLSMMKDGSMAFQYGPLSLAMRDGGLFLLNEIDLLDPSIAVGLNSILDGSPLIIPENGGEIIRPHKRFRFIATANSNGGGDDSGMYTGVLVQNMALIDRFSVIKAGYLDEDTEVSIVSHHKGSIPDDVVRNMVSLAASVRAANVGTGEGVPVAKTFSTRTLVQWAEWTNAVSSMADPNGPSPLRTGLDIALLNSCSVSDRVAILEMASRIFGEDVMGTADKAGSGSDDDDVLE